MRRNVYTNVAPFGLCTPNEQAEFRTMRDAGYNIIVYEVDGEWVDANARSFWLSKVYRVKRKETK